MFRRKQHPVVVELLSPDGAKVGEPVMVSFRRRHWWDRRNYVNSEPVVFSHLPEGTVAGFALYDMETGGHQVGYLPDASH